MEIPSESKQTAIHNKQTEQLYSRLKYSALGTMFVGLAMVFIIAPKTNDQNSAYAWFIALLLVSFYRWISAFSYIQLNDSERSEFNWRFHFNGGAYLSAIAWVLPMWLFYPVNFPEYQVLVILGLAGIAGGAISILSYDKTLITAFLGILLLGIESRLILLGGELSYQLALLVFLYFAFLIKGGRDIGDSYQELLELRNNTEEHNLTLLSTTEHMARIGYWQWDKHSTQIELSKNLSNMCGLDESHVDMDLWIDNIHPDDRQRVRFGIDSVNKTGEEASLEYRMHNQQEDSWIIMNQVTKSMKDASGQPIILATVQDISVIKSAEQKIFDMAYFDELTGLANRVHFRQHLIEQIKHAARHQLQIAILYIDLDGFKKINDTLGHDRGDQYLKEFSRRLKLQVRDEDFIARLGGDEFCMVLADIKDGLTAVQTAERCLSLKLKAIEIDHQNISPQLSIGIAIYPNDGADADSLLRASDAAMYEAKNKGKHQFSFYDPQMTKDATDRLELELELKNALKNNEFYLVYQPKVSLDNDSVRGVEALIRWNHPTRGMVPPDDFIPTAERIGLINEIGEWVIETACVQMQKWKLQGISLDMAINISSSHFSDDLFVEKIKSVKRQHNLKKGELEIEITESMSRDPKKHIQVCQELHELGIKVAIDDFGTGYSSLSVLKQLKVDTLKVDRAFIQHLPSDQSSAMMVSAIVNMALGLGFDVVAEGVETKQQADFLKNLGSSYVQGYYFSRPVEADQIPDLVMASNSDKETRASNDF